MILSIAPNLAKQMDYEKFIDTCSRKSKNDKPLKDFSIPTCTDRINKM